MESSTLQPKIENGNGNPKTGSLKNLRIFQEVSCKA